MFQHRDQFTAAQWATIRDLCLHERPYPMAQAHPGQSVEVVVIEDDMSVASIVVCPDGTATKSELIGLGAGWEESTLDQAAMEWRKD